MNSGAISGDDGHFNDVGWLSLDMKVLVFRFHRESKSERLTMKNELFLCLNGGLMKKVMWNSFLGLLKYV